jgi:hypothetical protein
MGSGWTGPGVNHTAEYQASGVPWVTGSLVVTGVQKIEFPNVTRFFKVSNRGGTAVSVGFTEAGITGDHGFTVRNGETEHFELRVRDIWISGSGGTVDILGGLTAISRRSYQPLTGANPPPEGFWFVPGIE